VRLKAVADKGEYIDPVKLTLGEFSIGWETWVQPGVLRKPWKATRQAESPCAPPWGQCGCRAEEIISRFIRSL